MVQTPFETLRVFQLRKKFSTIYGARMVFIGPLKTCQWSIICQFENCFLEVEIRNEVMRTCILTP